MFLESILSLVLVISVDFAMFGTILKKLTGKTYGFGEIKWNN